MGDFFQRNIEISERLFEAMRADHNARQADMEIYNRTLTSLIRKLDGRDQHIYRLECRIAELTGQPKPWKRDLVEHYIANPGQEKAGDVPELAEADE